ncbi:glycosyltransferase family 2 protein [Parashewanella tropica]|uniref:glycosyltransferase family 2 protein n=1 Tax=Parashewanella tropica TaxID=2547970 RepID=UPI00105959DF|nr:glycosyltransferase family 2 protein [Parashewanella tropica]
MKAWEINEPFLVSVLIPAKDEAENIPNLIKEVHVALSEICPFEVVLVSDGCIDATGDLFITHCELLQIEAQLVENQASVGQSTALYQAAQKARGKWLVTIDGDGQNNPADIPLLMEQAQKLPEDKDYCITGFRHQRKDTSWKRLQSKIANFIRNAILHDDVPDTGCGLKLIPKMTWQKLPYFDHMHRYLPALIKRMGGQIKVVPVSHRDRAFGVSKYTAWNRVWVGIVDLFGVRWLVKRSRCPVVQSHTILSKTEYR